MRRLPLYVGLLAVALAGASVFAGETAALASSSPGCGTTQDWHWVGQYHSDVLDGSTQSYPTVVTAIEDWESTTTAWQVRTKVWGRY